MSLYKKSYNQNLEKYLENEVKEDIGFIHELNRSSVSSSDLLYELFRDKYAYGFPSFFSTHNVKFGNQNKKRIGKDLRKKEQELWLEIASLLGLNPNREYNIARWYEPDNSMFEDKSL